MNIQYRKENSMRYLKEHKGISPEVYYHYTSTSALFEIIKNQSLWLTNLHSSNDKRELSYTYNDFLKDFDFALQSEEHANRKDFLKKAKEDYPFRLSKKAQKPNHETFGLCLCAKKDNLTHWDRYTDKCSGISIAINVAMLYWLILQKRSEGTFVPDILQINRVVYKEQDRIAFLNDTIDSIVHIFMRAQKESDISELRWYKFILPLAYFDMRNFVKDKSFFDEDELRIYYEPRKAWSLLANDEETKQEMLSSEKRYADILKNLDLEETRFAIMSKGIRSYHNLCLREIWGDGLIPEIMLGPMCTQDKKELRAFLNEYGLKGTKITESKVPIR